jgi:hypothetical protein
MPPKLLLVNAAFERSLKRKKKARTPAGILLCGRHRPMFLLWKLYVAQQQENFRV